MKSRHIVSGQSSKEEYNSFYFDREKFAICMKDGIVNNGDLVNIISNIWIYAQGSIGKRYYDGLVAGYIKVAKRIK